MPDFPEWTAHPIKQPAPHDEEHWKLIERVIALDDSGSDRVSYWTTRFWPLASCLTLLSVYLLLFPSRKRLTSNPDA
jgi:hypothetical protein